MHVHKVHIQVLLGRPYYVEAMEHFNKGLSTVKVEEFLVSQVELKIDFWKCCGVNLFLEQGNVLIELVHDFLALKLEQKLHPGVYGAVLVLSNYVVQI